MGRFRLPKLSPAQAGLVTIAILAVVVVVGIFKLNPLSSLSHQYQLTGVFRTANNIQPDSPVRTAGVNIGKVKRIEPMPDGSGAARVLMTIQDNGLPIHQDAQLKIRPRIFLEGNYFVDLSPGSPSAPELKDGSTVPIDQTATPVQLGQILDALDTDTRSDLQIFLQEYATKGLGGDRPGGGAEAYAQAVPFMAPAYRDTSIANQALLGTQPHDLSNVIRGQQRTFAALDRDEGALQDLITNFNIFAASLSRDPTALSDTITTLRDTLRVGIPALQSLNSSLPSLRGFAIDALPGTRSTPAMIDAMTPFIGQARQLVSDAELKGLVADLRPTVPALTQLNQQSIPMFEQTRALASCQNNVDIPFAKTPIPDPDFSNNTDQPFYKQSPRSLVALAGESRGSDADSPWFRILVGDTPGTSQIGSTLPPLKGVRPTKPAGLPPFRPDVPCETQKPPDLNAPGGADNGFSPPGSGSPAKPQTPGPPSLPTPGAPPVQAPSLPTPPGVTPPGAPQSGPAQTPGQPLPKP